MSRGVFLLGVGFAVVALVFAVTDWATGPHAGVTEENAKRIKPGMTLAEVETILGGPGHLCGSERDGHISYRDDQYCWSGPHGTVLVTVTLNVFEKNPAVVRRGGVSFHRLQIAFRPTTRPNFVNRLRSWLGW